MESEISNKLQMSSNSKPWRSRSNTTLRCMSERLSRVFSRHSRSSSSVSRASGVSSCQAGTVAAQ
ncbi:hypothetical protein FQZ97_1192450 [compost metagenome]